jgi:hypothetical protein
MAMPKDDQGITPETISFRQVARIAGWTDKPPWLIGFEHSVCSCRFPIGIAPSRRHAQLLCDSLNDRYTNQPMMPRFGWLPENDFPAQESVNIATSIRQAQTGQLRGEAATDIHSIAQEAAAVDETVADSVGPDIMSCDGPQPGRLYVFVRLFPGLLVSSPWKDWVVLPDGDVESVMLSDARKWAGENWSKVVAVVQKQSRLRMGTPPRREDEESEAVERLLAEALDRADRQTIKAELAADTSGEVGQDAPEETTSKTKTPTKTKRSTQKGEAREKLIAALTKHHKYADGGCLNFEPIGNNELAKLAKVWPSSASVFFKKEFKGHTDYKRFCLDDMRLTTALKMLNDEFSPWLLTENEPSSSPPKKSAPHGEDDEALDD